MAAKTEPDTNPATQTNTRNQPVRDESNDGSSGSPSEKTQAEKEQEKKKDPPGSGGTTQGPTY